MELKEWQFKSFYEDFFRVFLFRGFQVFFGGLFEGHCWNKNNRSWARNSPFSVALKLEDRISNLYFSANDDEQLLTVLSMYTEQNIKVSMEQLKSEHRKYLYDSSWGISVIESLYPHINQFFIPRGQAKANMHALVCYNSFQEGPHSQMRATMEADQTSKLQTSKGLQDNGFTLQKCCSAVDSLNATSTSISCLQSYPNGLRLANIWRAICFVLLQNEILQLHCEGFSYI